MNPNIPVKLSLAIAGGLLALAATAPVLGADVADVTAMKIDLNANGTPRFLDVSDLAGVIETSGDWADKARAVVAANADRFGIADPARDLALLRIDTDVAGNTHVHFGQRHAGVRVEGARLSVHFDRKGAPSTVTGLVHPSLAMSTTAQIGEAQAVETAKQAVRRASGAEGLLRAAEVELVVFDTGAARGEDGDDLLSWKVTVVGTAVREFVFLDAANGDLLAMFTGIHDARDRLTYDMDHGTSYSRAVLERSETTPPVGDADVDNAHDYAGDTYDFFFNAYGRDSIDDRGFTLKSYVHYGVGYQNAFWDGSRMTYGDGFPVDDVTAHEITHGLTQFTADLVYAYESGAINESFSDIFGEAIDLANGAGDDSGAVRWLMGEEIPGIGAIRDMSNPPAFGDPDRIGSHLYYCGFGDYGGVHSNSGVPNKLYYLLVDGGTFNGYTIDAIGLTKASAVHYQDLTQYLGPNSQMRDHFIGLWRSCKDLMGTELDDPITGAPSGEVISFFDCIQVLKAGLAVELLDPVCP